MELSEYSYKENYFNCDGNLMHYIDEGSGDVMVMLHGNPTWSYYYRHLIAHFSKTHRVIVPDHIGCGKSDKPAQYNYTLKQRIHDVDKLLKFLGIEKFSLVVHDWGGAIGFGVATLCQYQVDKIVILNTAAFRSDFIPWQINLVKIPKVGPFLIKYFNAFCLPATFMSTVKPLSKEVKAAYLWPYSSAHKRVAISEFVQDIPMHDGHQTYKTLLEIESKLRDLSCEKLIMWGKKDFCFNDRFLNKWKDIYPESRVVEFEDAGHYVLEDKPQESIKEIEAFIQ